MKAVILAAGRGTRMKPLTEDTPKPLLPVAGKPIIQHNIELLQKNVDEILVIAGYKIEQFEEYFKDDENVRIIEQETAEGTAHAALQAKEYIDEKTAILNGDDIYGEELKQAMKKESAVLAAKSPNPEKYGVLETENGEIIKIQEKPEKPASNFVNTGFNVVQPGFFDLLDEIDKSERGEFEITDALEKYIRNQEVDIVETKRWLPCSYPWQLIDANDVLMEDLEGKAEGNIEESSKIKGDVVIEKGAEIHENCVIKGPALIKEGCEIGPNAYIRPKTVLERNVKVGNSEIKNSVIRQNSDIPHFNYIGDSYIGKNVNMGAGSKTANLLNNGKNIEMKVKGDILETDRKKMGAIIGSKANIGINTSIKPGRKLGFKSITDAHEKVSENVPDNHVLKEGEIYENRD